MVVIPEGAALYQEVPPSDVYRIPLLFKAQPLFVSNISRDCMDGKLPTGWSDRVGPEEGTAGRVAVGRAGKDVSVAAGVVGEGRPDWTGAQAETASKKMSPPNKILGFRECIRNSILTIKGE